MKNLFIHIYIPLSLQIYTFPGLFIDTNLWQAKYVEFVNMGNYGLKIMGLNIFENRV